MKRIFVFAAVVVIALAMGMGVGGAIATEEATDNESDNLSDDLEDQLQELGEEENGTEYVRAIDSETVITDWEYTDGQFVVDIYAEEETTITMAESADWDEGAGEYRTLREEVDEGENTIYVATFADESDGVALSFATDLSMQEQRGPYISTGTRAGEDPFRHFGGTSGLLSGTGMTTGLAGLGAWIVVRQEESGVIEARTTRAIRSAAGRIESRTSRPTASWSYSVFSSVSGRRWFGSVRRFPAFPRLSTAGWRPSYCSGRRFSVCS